MDLWIELEYGLLDDLVSRGVIKLEEVKVIESNPADLARQNRLFDVMIENQLVLVAALKRARQRHVAVFIEQGGRKYSDYTA